MTNRERILCALRGGTPDRVPFTTYEWMFSADDPELRPLVERGLGLTRHVNTCNRRTPEVRWEETTFSRDGRTWRRRVMKTPIGDLEELYIENWRQEFFIKKPADYKVLEFVARHTIQEPDYEGFRAQEEALGERGVMIVNGYRSPIQEIWVENVGLANFCCHLADGVEELHRCYEALSERLLETCRIIAAGPGEFVKLWENFTAEPFGAERFARFHAPIYRKCCDILHASGKRVMAHTDGRLARVRAELNATPLDALESLTPPSEGDVPPQEWRTAWPDKALWVNVPVSWYSDPPAKFAARLHDLLDRVGSPRGLLLEISEDLPANWRQSIPVVLQVLEERAASTGGSVVGDR